MTWWFTDCPPHVFVSGDTGGGKTVFLKWFFYQNRTVSIFIDPMSKVESAPRATSVETVRRLLTDGERRIAFKPHWDDTKASDQIETLVEYLFQLAEVSSDDFQLVVDEVHNYAPKGDKSSPIVRVAKEGRNFGIKLVSASQEPQTVGHSILRQSGVHAWLENVNQFAMPYLEGYNLPIEEIQKNGEHEALVLDSSDMTPIVRTTAPSKYAH